MENAREVDKINIPEDEGGFDFFHGLGIIGYDQAFKMWLRKFPRPIVLVAMKDDTVVGWIYMEDWKDTARDGMAVYVLRAIEVHPDFRRKGIGKTLIVLSLREMNGYVITKPLTEAGKRFFREMGFRASDEFKRPPVDVSKQPNYLILSPYSIKKILKDF